MFENADPDVLKAYGVLIVIIGGIFLVYLCRDIFRKR